jgi:pimeloyl-ACP methyl ester carboxylesterase
LLLAFFALAGLAAAQTPVSFPIPDGTLLHADQYGSGERGIVLAHGGQFGKESWQTQAEIFAKAGFRVLAIQFRGDHLTKEGKMAAFGSDDENALDVLTSVRYLHKTGARTVSIVGGSLGGSAAAKAAAESAQGEIDRIVLLGSDGGGDAAKLKIPKLFILSRDDEVDGGPRLISIRREYEKALEPKKLVILEGSAHAQFIFATDQGERLMQELLQFLSEK